MAAFAVPAEFDPFLLDQQVNVLLIEGRAERVGMGGFAPLPVRLFVAFLAVACAGEGVRGDESRLFELCLAGKIRVLAKSVVVLLPDAVAVVSAVGGCGNQATGRKPDEQRSSGSEDNGSSSFARWSRPIYQGLETPDNCPELSHIRARNGKDIYQAAMFEKYRGQGRNPAPTRASPARPRRVSGALIEPPPAFPVCEPSSICKDLGWL